MTHNPFAPSASAPEEFGVFGDAILLKKGFLHRIIQLAPLDAPGSEAEIRPKAAQSLSVRDFKSCYRSLELTYNGWWFVQRVLVDGTLAWWAISWLSIERSIEFEPVLPINTDAAYVNSRFPAHVRIEIDFSRALQIRRFRVWLDHEIQYDEIC